MKKGIAALLLAAALLTVPSCGRGAGPERDVPGEERMEITVAFWDIQDRLCGDAVQRAIEDKFDVTLVPVQMTWDDYLQKLRRWGSTDSFPDLFAGDLRFSTEFYSWLDSGLLHPIPEDLSAYPDLQRYMDGFDGGDLAAADGTLYCIPRRSYPAQAWTSVDRVIVYRWDLARKAGVTREPENWQEFMDMILAIIREDPEHTGIRGMTAGSPRLISGALLPYASADAVADGLGFFWKLDEDGVYRPVYFADDLLPAFRLGREMYASGVIEREFLTQTSSSAEENFLRGENAAILCAGGFGSGYYGSGTHWREYHDSDYTDAVRTLRLMPDVNGQAAYPVWRYAWTESYISAGVSEEKLDMILRIYDYLLSEEGSMLASCGPEGDLYVVEDGMVRMTGEGSATEKYPSCGFFSNLVRWDQSKYDERFASDIFLQVNRELVRQAETVPLPEVELRCGQILRESRIDFSVNVSEDFLRIMTGEEPVEDMWREILEEYKERGLEETIETVNRKMEEERESS